MPRFNYIIRDRDGKRISGVEEGASAETVVSALQNKGFLVINVFPEEQSSQVRFRKQFTHKSIQTSDLVFFSRQLAVMLDASVPLLRTLTTIVSQVDSKDFYNLLLDIKAKIEGGLSLKEALSRYPKVFDDLWTGLVETGEASGTLPMVLSRLATYLEKKAALKAKIVSAIVYPCILILVASGAIAVFMFMVVPKFSEVFKSFNTKLPGLTLAVMNASTFIGQNILWIILCIVIVVVAFKFYVSKPEGKKNFDTFRLKLPLFGQFFHNIAIEQFAMQMSILVESGVPIVYALEITERAFKNSILGDSLKRVKEGVKQGKSISSHLEQEILFPGLLVQMVSVGEETGDLSNMLKKMANYYEEYVDRFATRLSSVFEPIMIVGVGLIIGTLVISMFLPIFSLANINTNSSSAPTGTTSVTSN